MNTVLTNSGTITAPAKEHLRKSDFHGDVCYGTMPYALIIDKQKMLESYQTSGFTEVSSLAKYEPLTQTNRLPPTSTFDPDQSHQAGGMVEAKSKGHVGWAWWPEGFPPRHRSRA